MEDSRRVYVEIGDPDRAAFEAARRCRDLGRASDELVALAFYDPDASWVQEQCLRLIAEERASEQARYIAVICLDHLLRIHEYLDFDRVLAVIDELQEDPSEWVRGAVQTFLRRYAEFQPLRAYLPLPEPDREAYLEAMRHSDRHAALRTLLALSRDEDTVSFAEKECYRLAADDDDETRRVAAVALRNAFVTADRLDFRRANPLIRNLRLDPVLEKPLRSLTNLIELRTDVDGYTPSVEPDREELTKALDRGDAGTVGVQLTALALEDGSWRWVQDVCLRLLHDRDPRVRVLAVRSLENLVYFRGVLDKDAAVAVLHDLEADEALAEPLQSFFAVLEDAYRTTEPSPEPPQS